MGVSVTVSTRSCISLTVTTACLRPLSRTNQILRVCEAASSAGPGDTRTSAVVAVDCYVSMINDHDVSEIGGISQGQDKSAKARRMERYVRSVTSVKAPPSCKVP